MAQKCPSTIKTTQFDYRSFTIKRSHLIINFPLHKTFRIKYNNTKTSLTLKNFPIANIFVLSILSNIKTEKQNLEIR